MTAPVGVGVGDLVDGKYRILRLIGEGGWGIVFEAENVRTLKRVALKVLRTHSSVTPDIQARFEREAQAAGRIGSEHIVEVFDLGTLADGTSYMVMELLSGEDLATRVSSAGKIEPVAATRIVVQLLEGLAAAHAAGILHRDLKPENLFLVPTRTGEEFVKILDFGISKFANAPAISATMTGAVLGSPFYMAPEQARGLKAIDARTDLYAVGTVLFECVTGRVPFEGDNFNDLMFRIVLAPRPNPIDIVPDLDADLVAIITKAISAEPADRYQTAEAFRDALADWLESKGLASVRVPELHRAIRQTQTPRSGSTPDSQVQLTPVHAKSRADKPQWSDATMAMTDPTLNETPVVSSSTLEPRQAVRRKRAIMVSVAAFAVLAMTGIALKQTHSHAQGLASEGAASIPAPPAPPVDPVPTAAATTKPHQDPAAATAATTAAAPDPAPVVELDDPRAPRSGAAVGRGPGSARGQHPAHVAHDAGAAPASADAPKPAPVASAPVAKPADDTVEGREIRTNL